jgi:thiamine transport system permease protein
MSAQLRYLGRLLSKPISRSIWYLLITIFFFLFILIPATYVLSIAMPEWTIIDRTVLSDPTTRSLVVDSFVLSFEIAAAVTLLDFIAGLPMAWVLTRREFRGRELVDTLIDMPLAVPTSALGFSVALFWSSPSGIGPPLGWSGGLVSSGAISVILVHVAFSYPYMVRSISAILTEIDIMYEIAGRTLGASPLTAARTITLPLFKIGLSTGVLLSFARSISETGATMIALNVVGSPEKTAPVLIGLWKGQPSMLPAASFVSSILIILAVILMFLVRVIVYRAKIPFRKVFPQFEKRISSGTPVRLRDSLAAVFLSAVVLIPSFFILTYAFRAEITGSFDYSLFWRSLGNSFLVAGIVTTVNTVLGIPMAIMIARKKMRFIAPLFDVLTAVPMIVPTAALGFSLGLFWPNQAWSPFKAPLWLLILSHTAFTYPFIVRNMAGALEEIDPMLEDAARSLGANPLQVFRRVTFPLTKMSILAGGIMMFTRSLGETGATLAVLTPEERLQAPTSPVMIVELVNRGLYGPAALSCVILIGATYPLMLILRRVTKGKVTI